MERGPSAPGKPAEGVAGRRAAEREARLAAALRSNLRRRKAQSRAREGVPGDARAETPDGPSLAAAEDDGVA